MRLNSCLLSIQCRHAGYSKALAFCGNLYRAPRNLNCFNEINSIDLDPLVFEQRLSQEDKLQNRRNRSGRAANS